MKKMKRLLALLLATMLVVSLAACGASNGGDAAEGEVQTITMYIGTDYTDEEMDEINSTVSGFEAENPGMKIELVKVELADDVTTQQFAAGGGPDIVEVAATTAQLYLEAGFIIPVDDYAEEYGWNELFDDWALDLVKRDGKMAGCPMDIDGLVVYYNEDMFAENGWQVPTTYEEYLAICEAAKAKDIIPVAFGAANEKAMIERWISVAYTVGLGKEKYRDLLQGRLPWESPEVKEVNEKLASMWEKGYIYENSAGVTAEDARDMFLNGQAAMIMTGQWELYDMVAGEADFDWSAFKMPSWQEGETDSALPIALGGVYVINKNAEHPDAVARFINYLNSDEYLEMKVKAGRIYPTSNSNPDEIEGLDPRYKEVFNVIFEEMEKDNIGYCTWTYWPSSTYTYARSNFESVYLGQLPLDEYLKNLQENFNEDEANNNIINF